MSIGRRRRPREITEYSSMINMPSPQGWGDTPPRAKGENCFRLEKGEIRFERLHLRLFPDRPILQREVEDRVIGKLSDDIRRPVLPTVIQPPRNERSGIADEIADYKNPGDRDAIRDDLFDQMRTLSFRIFAHTVIFLFLGAIELLPALKISMPDMFLPEKAPAVYLSLNLLLAGFSIFLCRHVYIAGFESITRLRPDGEGMLTLASTAVMLDILGELVFFFAQRQPVHRVCGAPLVLALLANDAGLMVMTRRVARNFKFVALRGMSMAVKLMNDDVTFDDLMHAGHTRHSGIAYPVRTGFLSGYINYSYEKDFYEQLCGRFAPYVSIAALLAGIIGGIVSYKKTGAWGGLYCLCAVLVAGIPICRLLCLNIPMDLSAQRLLPKGAMLNGWAGADEFGNTETLAVSSDMLFPRGTVRLLSAKAFGEAPLRKSVLYAASLVMAAGGPLAQIFEDLLEGNTDQLLPVEGIDYENEMGVSGFIDSRPVLVGNRGMLDLHECASPPRDYEDIIPKGSNQRRNLVYVAVSGVPVAVLLVEYDSDYETVSAVQRLVENGVSLVVYTCDANVTRQLISETYNIPKRFISIMSTHAGSRYDRLTHTILDSAPAVLATNGRLSALADGITAARRLRPLLVFTALVQLVCYGLGLGLVVLLCCVAGSAAILPAQILILQFICLAATLAGVFYR